ncbi:hypothetical protein GMJLKIPL_4500 [Methylobacterium isbiliense]|uniref:Uncharacterized protein n=2 Tax=Methylobacterium isbiliense TaxID=315478 RepID=A0ABQ4SJP5_9HYPH|nr:hypothetical protein GMJLKIPL_4500 [Methylobacterium isbiliense]
MRCDLVVVIYEEELELAELQAKTIARFIDAQSVNRLIYCINDEDPSTSSRFMRDSIFPVLARAGISTLECRRDHFTLKTGRGYCLQQVQKLEVSFRVQTDFYVVLDTKNFLVKHFDLNELFSGPYPAVFLETYEETDFRRYMKNMYLSYWGTEEPYDNVALPAMATPFVFNTAFVRSMIDAVEKKEGMPFGIFFEERFGAGGGYSEFLLYSSYLYNFQQRANLTEKLSHTSWGESVISPDEIHLLVEGARNNPSWKMCGIHKGRFDPVAQRTLEEIRKAIGL